MAIKQINSASVFSLSNNTTQTRALNVKGLSYKLGSGSLIEKSNFYVPSGSLTALIGPNGSGKTTLFKVLLGQHKKISGDIFLYGELKEKIKPSTKRKIVAYMPQEFFIDWTFPITVGQVVEMGLYAQASFFKVLTKSNKQWAMHCLEVVGLENFKNRAIAGLSGGEKRRMFFARMLAQRANFLMLDEPFSGIDEKSINILISVLQQSAKQGKTIFVVHHDLKMVNKIFNWVVSVNKNHLKCSKNISF